MKQERRIIKIVNIKYFEIAPEDFFLLRITTKIVVQMDESRKNPSKLHFSSILNIIFCTCYLSFIIEYLVNSIYESKRNLYP